MMVGAICKCPYKTVQCVHKFEVVMRHFRRLLLLATGLITFAGIVPAAAQTQCGTARSISYPVDPAQFQIVQDFGASSPRHQGRYHTGEDWYGGRGTSYGTYVRAIADGRVTFSSPNGWGRDGGVIIIEHSFPDGSTAYSMYGHVTDAEGVIFPAPFTCVREGDIIASVGDIRPAPHLHFEIRTNQPDIPGPGYTWDDPVSGGWRRPSKFIANWQAWFLNSTRWHADIADETGPVAPPVELGDHSLLVLDANRVLRISSDGRVLWRINLTTPAVGLIDQPDGIVIAYADGKLQIVTAEASLGLSWEIGAALDSPPLITPEQIVFHTSDNGLIALTPDARSVRWRLSEVSPVLRWTAGDQAIGIMTSDNALLTVAPDGRLLDRALLREPGSLATSGSDLIAYTRGGLWRIFSGDTWSLEIPDAPPGGRNSAVAQDDQRTFLFDGDSLYAYDHAGNQQWATPLPGVGGTVDLSVYENGEVVLLTSNHGDIVAVQAATGGVCNATNIYGSPRAREWHSLGDDGILRVYVADQVIGLNWDRFLMACG